jgi:hypothetical protein
MSYAATIRLLTILIDGKPTAFRSRDQQELLPTITQLKRTNQMSMKWFARGRLESRGNARPNGVPPSRARSAARTAAGWRAQGSARSLQKKHRPERAWSPGDQQVRRDRLGAPNHRPRKPWNAKPAGRPWESKPSGPRKP